MARHGAGDRLRDRGRGTRADGAADEPGPGGAHSARSEAGNDAGHPGNDADHLGIFGPGVDHDGGAEVGGDEDGGPTTGDLDADALREVLAGRADPEQYRHRDAAGPGAEAATGSGRRRRRRRARRRRGARKFLSTVVVVVVMALILGGLAGGVLWWRHRHTPPDNWAGTGSQAVVVRVQSGDSLHDVGKTLAGAGVVASAQGFVEVASDDKALSGLQPGYYMVHRHSSSQSVVKELADPDNRLGQLRIIPGETLADTTTVSTGGERKTKPGIFSAIADACVPTSGDTECFSADDVAQVAASASASDLGVVRWAMKDLDKAPDPARRLEGLILPGNYDIAPGSTAAEALTAVVSASAARWNTTTLVAAAEKQDVTPYQLATIGSLIQAEGIGPDMRKVARVIDNRLADGMKLQFDSTVNYGLDRAQISTTNAERQNPDNAYSTYAHAGLPPTPIGAVGPKALDAAIDPATGPWLYFVAVDKQGHSCFSTTFSEHQACIDKARANGVFG